jgi:hypothetical protein
MKIGEEEIVSEVKAFMYDDCIYSIMRNVRNYTFV